MFPRKSALFLLILILISTILSVFSPVQASTISTTQTPTITATPAFTETSASQSESKTAAGSTKTSEIDGMLQLYVPAGSFIMGSNKGATNAVPEHTVTLDAFWIDQTEVTNSQYAKCVASGSCTVPATDVSHNRIAYYGSEKFADFPVINVTYTQAKEYCTWAGRSLPTEAQWEKAARGTDGRTYPWGEDVPTYQYLNFFHPKRQDTVKVGSYPDGASPYGALDMAGNVWEWTSDWYEEDYYKTSPDTNPTGPTYGYLKTLRGGSWEDDRSLVRTINRKGLTPIYSDYEIGFRCVEAGS